MTSLKITDIRKSCCDRGFDLVTAVLLNGIAPDAAAVRRVDEMRMLVMESATAQKEIPAIGICCGDQYIRWRARLDHGLTVGEVVSLDGSQ